MLQVLGVIEEKEKYLRICWMLEISFTIFFLSSFLWKESKNVKHCNLTHALSIHLLIRDPVIESYSFAIIPVCYPYISPIRW